MSVKIAVHPTLQRLLMLISEVSRSVSYKYAIMKYGRLGNIRILFEVEEIKDPSGSRKVISGIGRAVERLVTSEISVTCE